MDRTTCGDQHTQLMSWVRELVESMGKHESHIKTSLDNQNEIFERLRSIQSSIDQRTLINVGVDKQIDKLSEVAKSNQENIGKLRTVVENGLSDRTKTIESSVACLRDCMEKFETNRKIREAEEKAGIGGFFKQSWSDFKSKFGWIIIIIIIWLLCWGFIKAVVFQEYPFPHSISLIKTRAYKAVEVPIDVPVSNETTDNNK